jgi:hypothetical protein
MAPISKKSNDLSKTSGTSPSEKQGATTQPWFVVDKEGLRKTLSRKGKAFAIYELLQNGFDEASTRVAVTLTEPTKGTSVLTCTDDSPEGYSDLSDAHTMFAASKKKSDEKKRGRFNVGEKHVLALCDKATITSTTGRVIFKEDGTRKHDSISTKVGSEFRGELPLTQEEFNEMVKQVRLVIPPIPTFFNGEQLPVRNFLHEFAAMLPTEIADENGVLRARLRQTNVRLYEVRLGETPMLYEMGMPVVEIECKWHIDIQQKVPLNIERDNVTPSYLKAIYAAVLNERKDYINEEDAQAAWVTTGLSNPKISDEAVQAIITTRFGAGAVRHDRTDLGANREAASKNVTVVPNGALTKEAWANVKRAGAMKKAGEVFPTSCVYPVAEPVKKMTDNMTKYKELIEELAPILINHQVTVTYINEDDNKYEGCTRWKKGEFLFEVNLAFHDPEDWHDNYELLLHEFAHHKVQSNDHLVHVFYDTVTELGAKLAQIALQRPELFPTSVGNRN